MNGHHPDAVDAQLLQVIQLGLEALQVADAVAVGIAERVDEHLVKGAVIIVRAFTQIGDICQPLL